VEILLAKVRRQNWAEEFISSTSMAAFQFGGPSPVQLMMRRGAQFAKPTN
jgi:hypothetical protein